MTNRYMVRPAHRLPVPGETAREAKERRAANALDRDEWTRYQAAKCAQCGMVRGHVSHEMDPDNSPEGPEYHADFAHHAFEENR